MRWTAPNAKAVARAPAPAAAPSSRLARRPALLPASVSSDAGTLTAVRARSDQSSWWPASARNRPWWWQTGHQGSGLRAVLVGQHQGSIIPSCQYAGRAQNIELCATKERGERRQLWIGGGGQDDVRAAVSQQRAAPASTAAKSFVSGWKCRPLSCGEDSLHPAFPQIFRLDMQCVTNARAPCLATQAPLCPRLLPLRRLTSSVPLPANRYPYQNPVQCLCP